MAFELYQTGPLIPSGARLKDVVLKRILERTSLQPLDSVPAMICARGGVRGNAWGNGKPASGTFDVERPGATFLF